MSWTFRWRIYCARLFRVGIFMMKLVHNTRNRVRHQSAGLLFSKCVVYKNGAHLSVFRFRMKARAKCSHFTSFRNTQQFSNQINLFFPSIFDLDKWCVNLFTVQTKIQIISFFLFVFIFFFIVVAGKIYKKLNEKKATKWKLIDFLTEISTIGNLVGFSAWAV